MAVLRQVCDNEPTPVRDLAPNVPAWLAEVIAALLAKKPDRRFPSAAELADLLGRHLAHLEEPARVPPPADTDRRLRRLRRRRPRLRFILVGALLLLVVGLGGYLLWSHVGARPRLVLKGHDGPVRALAFAPDEPLLATGGNDWTVRLWSTVDGKEVGPPIKLRSPVSALAYSRHAGLRASGSDGGSVELWPADPQARAPLAICHHLPTHALAFSPDGKTLAVATGKQVELLPVAQLLVLGSGHEADLSHLTGHRALPHRYAVRAVAYPPDGASLVSADLGGYLHVWPVGDARAKPRDLTAHEGVAVHSLAFHPDGHTLASAGEDDVVRLWDTSTWQQRDTLRGHRNGVLAVAFSPNGAVLASGSRDRTVKLWDADTGRPRAMLPCHDTVRAVVFSPDGKLLASAGDDKLVRLWDVERFTER
jgi:WD40 repeat protein